FGPFSGQTCSGGSWCDTTSWDTTSPSSCSYTTGSGDVGSHSYYAFVCDDDNACSSSKSGSFTVQEAAVGEGVWASCENGTLAGPYNWNYSMGYKFTANTNGQVTKLCGFFSGTKWVRLYNSSYSVLASAQIISSANWSCTSITPVNLTAGSVYYVAAEIASSGGYYRSGVSLAGCTNGITINASAYQTPSGTFNASHTEITPSMYGMADIVFSPIVATVPTVTTKIADVDIQNNRAILKGDVTDNGGEDPDHRYIDWDNDQSGEPYAHTEDLGSGGTGEYSTTINIAPNTIYYYRARAHNSAGDGV
ncbi:unnamed protein product, partial [marine sediment metagenome]